MREATCAALQSQSLIAASLDEARSEVDRLLMLDSVDPEERRRVVARAQLLLDGWRNMAGGGAAAPPR